MKRKHKRLTFVGVALVLLAGAAALVLSAFEENIVFFMSPTDIAANKVSENQRFRLGGLVEEGSIERGMGEVIRFSVTDGGASIPVTFTGVLPDLFEEKQGMVGTGIYVNGVFEASEILAKHDETYMPAEVVDALKAQGVYQEPES